MPHHDCRRSLFQTIALAVALTGCHRQTAPPSSAAHFWGPARPLSWPLPAPPIPWAAPPGFPLLPGMTPQTGVAGQRAALYARAQHGKGYCWGGTGPDCFDCSGLTSVAWRHAGTGIPRTSGEQRRQLRVVPLSAIEPGDVLWRPGHVGLYVGDGLAIHAPGRGKTVAYQPASRFREAHRP